MLRNQEVQLSLSRFRKKRIMGKMPSLGIRKRSRWACQKISECWNNYWMSLSVEETEIEKWNRWRKNMINMGPLGLFCFDTIKMVQSAYDFDRFYYLNF